MDSFGKLLEPLMKVSLPLMNNVLTLFFKSKLVPLGLIAAASAAALQKFIKNIRAYNFWLRNNNTYILNKEMSDIMKLVLEDSVLLKKGITQTIENETKNQRGEFLAILLGTLGASLLGNMLAG